jgi:hypothetical protein
MGRTWLGTAAAALVTTATLFGQASATRQDADSLERKLTTLLERGAKAAPGPRAFRTPIAEREVNAYFRHQGAEQLPVGVVKPTISIHDRTRVSGTATVDLDAVRKSQERTWTDPLAYVSGTLDVYVSGHLHTANGQGTFTLDTATLGGVAIPKTLLQELVNYYTRTPESPAGFNLDQPFTLPQRIRQVELQRGTAVIVQ